MTDYKTVVDGSYKNGKIGLGRIGYDSELEIIHEDSKRISDPDIPDQYGGIAAELYAAIYGLERYEDGQETYLCVDSDEVRFILKKAPEDIPEPLEPLVNELHLQIKEKGAVNIISKHQLKHRSTIRLVFNVAHNASAEASGSRKRQPTGNLQTRFASKIKGTPSGMEIIDGDKADASSYHHLKF